MRSSIVAVACVFAVAACTTKEVPRIREGQQLVVGKARELVHSPDGKFVTTLIDAEQAGDPGAPKGLLLGALHLAPTAGGPSRRLGGGVSNLPDAQLFSADGRHLAFLASYSVSRAHGELRLTKTDATTEPRSVAEAVTHYDFSPDGTRLAYVSDGTLYLLSLEGESEPVRLTSGVSIVEFAPTKGRFAGTLFAKRGLQAGGALLAFQAGQEKPRAIARGVRGFSISPTGDALAFQAEGLLAPDAIEPESKLKGGLAAAEAPGLYLANDAGVKRISEDAASEFRFSPDGTAVGFVAQPGLGTTAGDLFLHRNGATKKVASRVQSWKFAPDGSLALLAAWDGAAGAGTFGVLKPNGDLVEIARSVKQFALGPNGRHAMLSHGIVKDGLYSIALSLARLDAEKGDKPRELDIGVFGYLIDATGRHLAYKARCIDDGRACTLFHVDLEKADAAPVELVKRVAAFEFVPNREELVIVTSRRAGKHSGTLIYELGAVSLSGGGMRIIDDTMTGEHALVAGDRVAYLVDEAGKAGLYVAPIPTAPTK